MAEKDIIQNMISQLGQSQQDRLPDELGIHYADIDERTTEDLLSLTHQLSEHIQFYRNDPDTPTGTWKKFFETGKNSESEEEKTPPHLALFLAFLELYKKPQSIINEITGRHLDYYYRKVLHLKKKDAAPDKAHVVLELKKNASPVDIVPQEDLFSASKDSTDVEMLYDPTAQTVINASKVESLRSIYLDTSGHGTIRSAPIANSSDGLGGALSETEAKWYGFGHAGLPAADVGFAIASPVLRMQEGTRTVNLTLTVTNADQLNLDSTTLSGALEAYLTGETSWIGPLAVTASLTGGTTLDITVSVPASEQAVIDYDQEIHGYSYAAQAPIVQVLLKTDNADAGYSDFKDVTVATASISVEVSCITALQLESDAGTLDPKKAFLPFGSRPGVGSRFLIGYDEALSKKLSSVAVTVEWKDVPSDLDEYYEGYGAPLDNDGVEVDGNDYFTTSVVFEDGGTWKYSQTSHELFDSSDASEPKTFTFTPDSKSASKAITPGMKVSALTAAKSKWATSAVTKFLIQKPVFTAFKTASVESKKGYITFSLEKSFLHSTYPKKYVENVLNYDKTTGKPALINEPYTPTIRSIELSYNAHSDTVAISSTSLDEFSTSDLQFFHIAYFGQMREHGYQRDQFEFLTDKDVALLPLYRSEGELLIGFSDLEAGDGVSVLFQVAEGSADPDLDQEDISWFVLCDNYWKPLETSEVTLDTTNQLLTSGIIKFVIPPEATTDNTILPSDQIWIKAAIEENVIAVGQLIDVAANAIEAQFADQGNDPAHLQASLEAGTITKLKNGLSAVKSVAQPYSSFGGSPEEADEAFSARVAERLRHKNRCITAWDYERIILEGFPKVHKVKCIPHAREGSWLAPGHVLIVVVPDLKNKNAIDPLQPKVDANTISLITSHVEQRTGSQISVKVKNPSYQKIQLEFKVKFHAGYEFNYYSESLNQSVIEFLSPWAFDSDRDLSFGGKVYKSVLLDFVEELEYVDYVTDFKMYSYIDTNDHSDINEAQPAAPDAILVSEEYHLITEVT